ncbi:cyclopropane-fatty-acyl-phospholipid synthase-like protein [Dinothrombium tinctorium]|uniref:Cyclopropane-fatty-acyl-phospholipid synthase-like protein n=1 Tax=Dinothrombium tinctorium TaxID=1965070 RepID=A0A3S3P4N7_9ACAR|nr:cyclopropane-fatty-acyl-phospholipid synthase-like protein [Dinothrombium tinctorium]RWS16796.1 cyclopropane-fatty-acyl-phospholipid synthase-like protein [Dinothrombium tinctorium]RWS16798.1 cyclopropane-fatty-acyl-phospholipid synthase-like protein [Dinothrombium tinctorium]
MNVKAYCNEILIDFTNLVITALYYLFIVLGPVSERLVTEILRQCGIVINGSNASDIKVLDNRFYAKFLSGAWVGIAESYVDKYFECDDLIAMFAKLCKHKNFKYFCYHPAILWYAFIRRHFGLQSDESAYEDGGKGYDEGVFARDDNKDGEEEIYRTYSCAYWRNANSLEEALNKKLELVANKLKLKSGMRVLDVGCGEGTFCRYLAENFDVSVVGVNISKEMAETARKNCRNNKNVVIKRADGRKINETYDRIVCIEVIELMGIKNLRPFFETVHRCLSEDGLFFIECVAVNHPFIPITENLFEKFTDVKTAFPYFTDITNAIDGLFVIEDWQNIGTHYARMFKEEAKRIEQLQANEKSKFDEKVFTGTLVTYRFFSAMLASRYYHVYHIVLSKNGVQGGYDAVV